MVLDPCLFDRCRSRFSIEGEVGMAAADWFSECLSWVAVDTVCGEIDFYACLPFARHRWLLLIQTFCSSSNNLLFTRSLSTFFGLVTQISDYCIFFVVFIHHTLY